MTHPIVQLQGALVAALRDAGLTVFDAPPAGQALPYVAIARHDLLPRDGDEAPGYTHRVLLHAWAGDASRKAVLALADTAVTTALGGFDASPLLVTLARHDRTETLIDGRSGRARAATALTFYTEPA